MFPISDDIPHKHFPWVNLLLVAVTAYVFLQELFAPDTDAFIMQYALIPSHVNFADINTLVPFITAIFLHGGFLHIISNLWFLWVFGDNTEDAFGLFLYPVMYLISGIVGNLLQYLLMPNSSIPLIGASGAIAGVLGAYFVLYPHAKIKTLIPIFFFPAIVSISAPIMLGYWFFLQLISGASSLPMTSDMGGVAFWAHVGGFITGIILTKLLAKPAVVTIESE